MASNIIYGISYGDESFSMSRDLNLWTAQKIGKVDKTIPYGPNDIDIDYWQKNSEILSQARGGGFWLWKPYIILKTLNSVKEGDYVFYTDAGMVYVKSIRPLIDIMNKDKQDICLSSGFVPAKDWCKRDCFILMGCDCKDAYERIMVSGGYVLIKKTSKSIRFVEDWLKYSMDKRCITDSENELNKPNISGFKEHRHDQAILSNLCYLYNIYAYKGMTHVDEPRDHIRAIKGNVGAYGYSFEERLVLMRKEHELEGYKKSKYGRLFINTRIRNCSGPLFTLKLIKKILSTIYIDLWGFMFDKHYLKG